MIGVNIKIKKVITISFLYVKHTKKIHLHV